MPSLLAHASSVHQRVNEDVDVHHLAVGDLIAAATTATFGMRRVIQSVLAVEHT